MLIWQSFGMNELILNLPPAVVKHLFFNFF